MNAPIVRFAQVRKSFGTREVLRGVDLEVPRGAFLGLAGVNGAGKTTLIKCMLDLCGLDSGTITIRDMRHTVPDARAALAFLPERFVPPWYLTGRDFLRFSLSVQGTAWDEARVLGMVDALDLDREALRKPVRALSKGMTQKLGLAATFLAERELLVLDEPMSGLDPRARACVKRLLDERRHAGRSLFITSHSLTDIEEICDRIVVLHRGVAYFAGTPGQLCQDFGGCSIEQAFLRCIEAQGHD